MGGFIHKIAPEHQEFRDWLNTLTPEQRKIRDRYFNFKGSKQFFLQKHPEAKDLIRERPNTPYFIYKTPRRKPTQQELTAQSERIAKEAPQSEEFKVAQRTAQQPQQQAQGQLPQLPQLQQTQAQLPQAQQPQGQQQQVQSVTGTAASYGGQQSKPQAAQQMTAAPVMGGTAQQVANQGIGGTQQPVNQFRLPQTTGLTFGGA